MAFTQNILLNHILLSNIHNRIEHKFYNISIKLSPEYLTLHKKIYLEENDREKKQIMPLKPKTNKNNTQTSHGPFILVVWLKFFG